MHRKFIFAVIMAVLTVLSILQIIIDYSIELNFKENSKEVVEHPEYCIFVEIEDKTLYLLQDGKCIKKYAISSGKPQSPSPLGYWYVVSKGDWGEGFGGRWMGLNVTWGEYGIHGTHDEGSIGYNASHGCIRMYNEDVKDLYDIVPCGTPVAIVNGPFGAFGRGFQSMEPGDRGADVMAIQKMLKELGYFKGWISGVYEDDLKVAVHNFQRKNGLEVTNTITRKCWLAMGYMEFE